MTQTARNDWRIEVMSFTAGLLLAAGYGACLPAAAPAQASPSLGVEKSVASAAPQYPHITVSTWYQVDPSWPQRPAGVTWGQTPGLAVDNEDRVWVFTRGNPPVQVYDASGRFLRSWGQDLIGRDGDRFTSHQIRFDREGMIWLVDVGQHVVMRVTPEGKLLKMLGTKGEPGEDERHFNKPTDVAITPRGDLFISDGYGNSRVVHFDRDGRFVKAWGKRGTGPGEFSLPHSIVVDSKGRLYVADRNNARVQVFDQEGNFLDQWQDLMVPWSLWINDKDEIWVCGCSPMQWREEDGALSCPPKDQLFVKFDTTGRVRRLWTVPKAEDGKEQPGELNWVHGIALDSQGNIYASDIMGQRVQKFVRQ